MTHTPPRRAITARKDDGPSDWYSIEWLEHDGRTWLENAELPSTTYYCMNARLEPRTSVEGPLYEMCDLARAVMGGYEVTYKRCAVTSHGDHFAFWSPRNSNGRYAVVHGDDARAWAETFLAEIGG